MSILKKNKYQKLYTEGSIQKVLFNKYFDNNSFLLRNKYVYEWESDFFYLVGKGSTNSLGVEHEIKRTRSDWAKEVKGKNKKHKFIQDTLDSGGDNLFTKKGTLLCPNYFIITCPKDMITLDEVEENFPFASLSYIDGDRILIKKKLKIHNHKLDYKEILIFKLYNELMNQEFKLQDLYETFSKLEGSEECCAIIKHYLKKNRHHD